MNTAPQPLPATASHPDDLRAVVVGLGGISGAMLKELGTRSWYRTAAVVDIRPAALEAAQRACEASGSPATRAQVLAELPRTRLTDTILGRDITFDAKGDVVGASFSLYRVAPDGGFTRVESGVPAS